MSQHAGLFFPEREWPVGEDILHAVSVFSRIYTSLWMFSLIMNKHLYSILKKQIQPVVNGKAVILLFYSHCFELFYDILYLQQTLCVEIHPTHTVMQ